MRERFSSLPAPAKWILGIIFTVFVGSLGSGFWEIVVKPLLSFLSNLLVKTAIATNSGFSNSIYSDIANGLHENQSASILSMTYIIYIIVIFISFMLLNTDFDNRNKAIRKLQKRNSKIKSRTEHIVSSYEVQSEDTENKHVSFEDQNSSIEAAKELIKSLDASAEGLKKHITNIESSRRKYRLFFISTLALYFIISAYTSATNYFVNKSITEFDIKYDKIRPFISDKEAQIFVSKFRRIENSNDYKNLNDELNIIIKAQKL